MPPVPVAPVRHARVHAKSQLIRAGGHCGASFRRRWSGKVQTAVGSRNPKLHSAVAPRNRHDPEPEQLLSTAATCANCCVIYCTIAPALLHNDLLCGEIVALWVIDWCSCERRPDLFPFSLVQGYFEHVRALLKIQWASIVYINCHCIGDPEFVGTNCIKPCCFRYAVAKQVTLHVWHHNYAVCHSGSLFPTPWPPELPSGTDPRANWPSLVSTGQVAPDKRWQKQEAYLWTRQAPVGLSDWPLTQLLLPRKSWPRKCPGTWTRWLNK